MIPTEPIWKSYIVETTEPIFTPQQCQLVINKGMSLKKEEAAVGISQKPGGGIDPKKELLQLAGYLLKICQRCIKILKLQC
jgi:hypothetical protein